MSSKDQPVEPQQGRRGEKITDWAEGRLGYRGVARTTMRKAFPDHWSFMLGEICLYSFVIFVLTGVYPSFYFHLASEQVIYQGSYAPLQGQLASDAFDSTLHISFDVRGGLLIRQAHHWAALASAGSDTCVGKDRLSIHVTPSAGVLS